MSITHLRRILGILLLVISLALLAWGLWPLEDGLRTLPVEPTFMQLPTSQSIVPVLRLAAGWSEKVFV